MEQLLPYRKSQFDLNGFMGWLHLGGAEIQQALPYNAIRYKWEGAVHIVYYNEKEVLRFTGETADHYKAFLAEVPLVLAKTPRMKSSRRKTTLEKLRERDGDLCFYSNKQMQFVPIETPRLAATIEHLKPVSDGGGNELTNLVLCTQEANQWLGDLDLISKLKLRSIWWTPEGPAEQIERHQLGFRWLSPIEVLKRASNG